MALRFAGLFGVAAMLFWLASTSIEAQLPSGLTLGTKNLKIISFNIAAHCNPPELPGPCLYGNPEPILDTLADYIVAQHADIVGLQEIADETENHLNGSGQRVDMPSRLLRKLLDRGYPMFGHFAHRNDFDPPPNDQWFNGGQWGQMVLSRTRIDQHARYYISYPAFDGSNWNRRNPMAQTFSTDVNGNRIRVFELHASPPTAINEMPNLATFVSWYQSEHQPDFVIGDFNLVASNVDAQLEAVLGAGSYQAACQFFSPYCAAVADLIFFESNGWTATSSFIDNSVTLSDHYPRVATFQLTTFFADPGWSMKQGDFDANGVLDKMAYNRVTGEWGKMMNGSSAIAENSFWSPGWDFHVGRFDANNSDDVFLYNDVSGQAYLAFSTVPNTPSGCSVAGTFCYQSVYYSPNWNITILNHNGDSVDDIYFYDVSSGYWYTGLNGGQGFSSFTYYPGQYSPGWTVFAGEINGDGREDLVMDDRYAESYYNCLAQGNGSYSCGSALTGLPNYPNTVRPH